LNANDRKRTMANAPDTEEHKPTGGRLDTPDILNSDEAAAYLGIGRTALFELLRTSDIPCKRLSPKIVRFGRDALKEWIDASELKCYWETTTQPERHDYRAPEQVDIDAPASSTAGKQARFIELIATGLSDTKALKELGYSGSTTTVTQWRGSHPSFDKEYTAIRTPDLKGGV